MQEWVEQYRRHAGRLPNIMVVGGRRVRYRGRPPWFAAYWQRLASKSNTRVR